MYIAPSAYVCMYAFVPVPLREAARDEICGHFSGRMGRELARALETRRICTEGLLMYVHITPW